MPPVSNPDMAEGSSCGPSSSSSSSIKSGPSSSKVSSTSQVSSTSLCWPESVQMRLKELEQDLEEEEITKKGFWKKKFKLVETFLNKTQVKDVQAVQQDSKDGKLSDKEYFEKLTELLQPMESFVDEGPSTEEEAMNVDEEKVDSLEKSEVKPSGDEDGAGPSGSKKPEKRSKDQPSIMDMFKKKPAAKKQPENKRKSSSKDEAETTRPDKKVKDEEVEVKEEKDETKLKVQTSDKVSTTRCDVCRQLVDSPDTARYENHPDGAVEECIGIFDKKLSLFDDEGMGEEGAPQYKLTGFTVYDKKGHVVPFDTGLIDKNKDIYFSGYLKHLTSEDPSNEDGVPVYDCGPIGAWWNAGFDGGEKALTGFTTAFAEYYLMEPSELYQPLMKVVDEKVFLTKHVIEYLEQANANLQQGDPAEYEDLLNHLSTIVPPEGLNPLGDEVLLRHADFVVNQVYSYENAGDEDEPDMVSLPAMKSIIKLAGIKLTERKKLVIKRGKQKPQPKWTAATVTPLVRSVFDTVFKEQMIQEKAEAEGEEKVAGKKRARRCGHCEACLRSDCGSCNHCRDMTKYGGSGKSKQACVLRKCPNMEAEEAAEESMSEGEAEVEKESKVKTPVKTKVKGKHKDVEWVGEGTKVGRKTYYKSAVLDGDLTVTLGDNVLIQPAEPATPLYVAIVTNLFEGKEGPTAHVQWFSRGTDTMLGEAGDPSELFLVNQCEDQPLLAVWKKCVVTMKAEPDQSEWRALGGSEPAEQEEDDGISFTCNLWYGSENARFEYPRTLPKCPEGEEEVAFCGMCGVVEEESSRYEPALGDKLEDGVGYSSLTWDRASLRPGDAVYLTPGSAKLIIKQKSRPDLSAAIKDLDEVDEDLYTEYYRKRSHVKGSNMETPEPFQLVVIKAITGQKGDVKLKVQLFYRPENTHKGPKAAEGCYYNQVYWSEEEATVPFSCVTGRCHIRFADLATTDAQLEIWTEEGPDRWFFREWYNADEKSYEEPPASAQRIGQKGKGGGKGGKGKSSAPKMDKEDQTGSPVFPPVAEKLRCLDVFSGCGGLSAGLHEAGVATSKWAIEVFEPAANAYKLNNPDCTVFTDDCNLLLKFAVDGVKTNHKGQKIPERGEVDLLCGGPPCQGYSGMNRFNHREYSQFKCSLVSTYLSYCEFYRPKFFILENVRNFASYKKSMVLKLCIRALVKMGYQCSFGVLQAGQFGVAQTRRRCILLASAPGETLPLFPEPRHVFSPQACHLSVEIEVLGQRQRFSTNARWVLAGPYRTTTVRDTMSDLPRIKNGHSKLEISYGSEAYSNFQKKIRRGSEVLRDHVTKDMAPLIEARFSLIPTAPGSDWRDLPNKVMTLKDGSQCRKLVYCYNDKKQGRSSTGAFRGVCTCADGVSKCDPADKQQNTLVPWCLPHTSNRHNQWAGLYGRVAWDGFFSTTITNPEPMGKQGRVLHPDQTRLVSVRECARSQGFPDTYKFHGTTLDKHRQVGNAVPPPMGKALGLVIRQAMAEKRN